MHFTSIAYKFNHKIYIGQIESGLKSIESFKPLSRVMGDGFLENILYVVMIADTTASTGLYELDKIPFVTLASHIEFNNVPDDEKLMICNTVLKQYTNTLVLH
jgi:hypothetical protein